MQSSGVFKRWSIKYIRQFILAVLFFVVVLAMALFMLSAGLRCVDENGCLREHYDALLQFNRIKDLYSTKIEELTELKRHLFNSPPSQSDALQIDHQLRSKLRITIESLLIDLNEEVFAISEELAKSFTFDLGQKAKEFEQRQKMLIKKIKDSVENNPSIRSFRRNQRIQNHQQTPPQRDLNTFGMNTITDNNNQYQQRNSQRNVPQEIHNSFKNPSPSHNSRRLYSSNSAQRLGSAGSESKYQRKVSIGDMFENMPPSHNTQVSTTTNQRMRSLKKKASPIPLRRKGGIEAQDNNEAAAQETIQLMRASHSNSNRGGGANQMSAKKQLVFQEKKILGERQPIKKNTKKLEEFERFLAKKTKQTTTGGQSSRRYSSSLQKNKENYNTENNFNSTNEPNPQNLSTLVLQSEALELFSQDFTHMKSKLIQIIQRLTENEDRTQSLEDQVQRLKTENLKLTTDMKIIRNEHSELTHQVYNLEKKNNQIQQENQILKKMVSGERGMKGQESNLPKQYSQSRINNNQSNDVSMMSDQQQQRKQSPFSSFLQRNRSFSNQRDINQQQQDQYVNMNSSGTLRNINFQQDMKNNTQDYNSMNQNLLNQSYDVRNSQNQQWPNNNPLLSGSNERPPIGATLNQNMSYQMLRQPAPNGGTGRQQSRQPSVGQSSLRGEGSLPPTSHQQLITNSFNFNPRLQMTPTTPGSHIGDETPHRVKIGGNFPNGDNQNAVQQNKYLINNKLTPNSLNSSHIQPENNNNTSQLSDWVLERIKNK